MIYNFFYSWMGWNEIFFTQINNFVNTKIVFALMYISQFSSIESFAIFYISICLYYYHQISAQKKQLAECQELADKLIPAGLCYTIFGLVFAALKFTVNLPRPYCSMDPGTFSTIIDPSTERCLSSFPSAHTGIAIIIAVYLWQYANNYGKIALLSLILITATSRISLAVHYPADIIYSGLITTIIIMFSNQLYKSFKENFFAPITKLICQKIFEHI